MATTLCEFTWPSSTHKDDHVCWKLGGHKITKPYDKHRCHCKAEHV